MSNSKAVHRLNLPLDRATLTALHRRIRKLRRTEPAATLQDAIRSAIRETSARVIPGKKRASAKG